MNHILSNIILYQNFKQDSVLKTIAALCAQLEGQPSSACDTVSVGFALPSAQTKNETSAADLSSNLPPSLVDSLRSALYDQVRLIMECGTQYGFDENLWQNYLTFLLVTDENPFSLVSEKRAPLSGSAAALAMNDYQALMQLMHYDFSRIERALSVNCFSVLTHYQAIGKSARSYYKNISDIVRSLSKTLAAADSAEAFRDAVSRFYQDFGVGMFGLNKAFRIRSNDVGAVSFLPINNMEAVSFDDLVGYEYQKNLLCENTRAFVEGRSANNVLLYGDAGTGKSTSIKAVVNAFYPQGLRMIEIYKHQFKDLSTVISQIKNRNYRFIIYMDDLSFEEFEIEYKYLKAVIEGGMETRPDNILIYATSNRRHLIRETWKDRDDMEHNGDVHRSDTMEEKLSLVDRFGLNILYSKPSFDDYHRIVLSLAKKQGIQMDETALIREADKWSVRKAGYSGRIAQQFINSLNAG